MYGPIAMVNGAAATPTSVGTFHVYYKNPLMTMRGSNADGTDYETPDVPWSSFFVGGIALHGAPWRSSFGYAASHGCVNLPVSVAKWVYDFATDRHHGHQPLLRPARPSATEEGRRGDGRGDEHGDVEAALADPPHRRVADQPAEQHERREQAGPARRRASAAGRARPRTGP